MHLMHPAAGVHKAQPPSGGPRMREWCHLVFTQSRNLAVRKGVGLGI
jgi:hypothetical protein